MLNLRQEFDECLSDEYADESSRCQCIQDLHHKTKIEKCNKKSKMLLKISECMTKDKANYVKDFTHFLTSIIHTERIFNAVCCIAQCRGTDILELGFLV